MREAVTAALVHDEHILAVRRQPYLPVFPGYLAFPGGKIDSQDEGYDFGHPLVSGYPSSQIRALCRELKEEIDFDLERALALDEVAAVSLLGTSVTPIFDRYRFRVYHFKIQLRHRPEIHADRNEIAWSDWVPSSELLRRYDHGEELMVIPTRNIIKALAGDSAVERIAPLNLEYDQDRELPFLELLKGVGIIPVPSITLPPARYTNALVVGDPGHPVCLIDPSPESDQVCRKLFHTLRDHSVDALLITHHHPDHHQFAPHIARRLQLPLLCSLRTEQRLKAVYGNDYLEGLTVRHLAEGHSITYWQGRSVRCYELPGHDDGMIGLAPEDMSWFMVSDLIQTMGSVVIPEPEGEMQAYLDTLQRIIALDPRFIIPAHGLPAGGTWLLEQVLEHRLEREDNILFLHHAGRSIDEILEILYVGLEEKLVPLARQNIRQHMRKLGLIG